MSPLRYLTAMCLAVLLAAHGLAAAAPISADPEARGESPMAPLAPNGAAPTAAPQSPLSAPTGLSSGTGTGSDETRSIELLLDMGAKNPPAAGLEAAKPKLSPEAARIAAKVLTPSLPAPGAAGDLSNAPRRAQPGDPDWVPTKPLPIANPFGRDDFRERPRSGDREFPAVEDDEDDVRLLPKALVRFIKQNRELVIGAGVVALILGFVVAALQRR